MSMFTYQPFANGSTVLCDSEMTNIFKERFCTLFERNNYINGYFGDWWLSCELYVDWYNQESHVFYLRIGKFMYTFFPSTQTLWRTYVT